MRKTNKIIIAIILISVMLLGIGYAAIQNITLNITGTATADPSQANFTVKFSGEPTVSDASKVEAAITDDVNATINVEGLTAAGESVTATYTVQNTSKDLSANLSVLTSNSNEEYFLTESKLAKPCLTAGQATTLTVTVKLIKTPITATEKSTIGIRLTAEPVQPGEENTEDAGSSTGGTTSGGTATTTSAGTYLPTGFKEVQGTSLTNGITIEDAIGNQYVWVEVPKTTTVYPTAGIEITDFTTDNYTKIENDLHTYTSAYRESRHEDTWDSEEQHGFADADAYNAHKNTMLASVFKNEGFYVGKYETGIADTEPDVVDTNHEARTSYLQDIADYTPVIQANAYPYNYLTNRQAQELASTKFNGGGYTTSLMFGLQWDLVLKHLEVTNVITVDELISDSTWWGNFKNTIDYTTNANGKYSTDDGATWTDGAYERNASGNVLLSTGAFDYFWMGEIYDLAGNVFEWTLEYSSSGNHPCVMRGGAYNCEGYDVPTSNHSATYEITGYSYVGFRVCLF